MSSPLSGIKQKIFAQYEISKLDSMGNLTIEFTEEMNMSFSLLNETNVKITVLPSDKAGARNLNLTWKVLNFT